MEEDKVSVAMSMTEMVPAPSFVAYARDWADAPKEALNVATQTIDKTKCFMTFLQRKISLASIAAKQLS
ncbi:MAG: hypothetical protein EBT28_09240 [Betaproteobacteria bacterium]|nr:hypothetical protein [Betaproteobacteria bacterium]